jgi:phospholipid transport system substrate-binding protein
MAQGGVMPKIGEMIRGTVCLPRTLIQWTACPRCVFVLAWIGILLLYFSVAWGAGTPTQAVKETIDQVLSVLADEALKDSARTDERREKLEAIIRQRFDYEEMAKRTLAAEWKKISTEKQEEFVELFQQFLTQSYAGNVDGYSGEQVEYLKERLKGDFAEVQTKVVSPKVQIPLDYRLLKKHDKWGVYDVIIDGVSLTKNYRGQFSRIIKSSSFETLLDKLRSKADLAASS